MPLKHPESPNLKAFILKAISIASVLKAPGRWLPRLPVGNRRKQVVLLAILGVCVANIWAVALLLLLTPEVLIGPQLAQPQLAEVAPTSQSAATAPLETLTGRPVEGVSPGSMPQTPVAKGPTLRPTATRPRPPATWTPAPSPSPSPSPSATRTASPVALAAGASNTLSADRPDPPTPLPATAVTLTPPADGRYLLVNQDEQRMHVYENGLEVRQVKVSTGQPVANAFTPAWRGKVGPFWGSAPFRNSDLWADYIWYLFPGDQGSILIHSVPYTRSGNTKIYDRPEALGVKPASRGCIRISPEDAEWLAAWNPVGVLIEITPWSGQIGPADETLWPNG